MKRENRGRLQADAPRFFARSPAINFARALNFDGFYGMLMIRKGKKSAARRGEMR